MSGRKLVTVDEAVTSAVQHTKPCSDCPFARAALPGWLAGDPPELWMRMAHGETRFECHTILPQQCAGSAIYRANVCKRPPDGAIKLPADRERVFASPMEFMNHHARGPVAPPTCQAALQRARGVFDPNEACGKPAHYRVGTDALCLTCARRRAKVMGCEIGPRDPWTQKQGDGR